MPLPAFTVADSIKTCVPSATSRARLGYRRAVNARPESADPPVVEMVLGVQFRSLLGLRGIALGPLRERWRDQYPRLEEQPPLPPAIEGVITPGIGLQLGFGPGPPLRQWFLSADGGELIQLQNDRLIVNWRRVNGSGAYPRYKRMRELFEHRLEDLADFVEKERMGTLEIVQAEANYINAVEIGPDEQGEAQQLLRAWSGTPDHHLGEPEQARIALVFPVPGLGRPPVRMHVSLDPAERPVGRPVLFMTLTVRGAPADSSPDEALTFLDGAHDHLDQSFLELTPETMHSTWGLRV
jgi:uncharacterized protein (TIGR04255 family)